MAIVKCKECKAQVSTTAKSCPHCGAKVPKTSGCALIVAAFFVFCLIMLVFGGLFGSKQPSGSPAPSQKEASASIEAPAQEKDPAEILAENQQRLIEVEQRYKENQEYLTQYYSTPQRMEQILKDRITVAVIMKINSSESNQAALTEKATKLKQNLENQHREFFASGLEESFIKSGMNATVRAMGTNKETLRIDYVLMSRVLVYRFQNESQIPNGSRNLGFKTIIYNDGHDGSLGEYWTVELDEEAK